MVGLGGVGRRYCGAGVEGGGKRSVADTGVVVVVGGVVVEISLAQ